MNTATDFVRYCVERQHAVTVGFFDANRRRLKVLREIKYNPKASKFALKANIRECLDQLVWLRGKVAQERRWIEEFTRGS